MTRSETSACLSSGRRSTSVSARVPSAATSARKLTPSRVVSRLIARCSIACCSIALGCNTPEPGQDGPKPAESSSHDTPAAASVPADQSRPALERGQIVRALDALLTPLPKPLRILTITALPTLVVVQVQNTQNPSEVHQYQYTHADGRIEGPQKVKLMGKGSLKDNLFRPPSAEPRMAEDALTNVTNQYKHPARKLVMIRNLPESMDIQFRVTLDTPSGELVVVTDKHGRVLGPLAPSAANNNPPSTTPSGSP